MITSLQSKCLHEVAAYQREHDGVAPSYEELRSALGVKSKSEVHRLLTGLEERGFVRRLKGKVRAIEVLRLPGEAPRAVPPLPIPAPASGNRISLRDMAEGIASEPWCSADADTVLACLRELRK